MYKGVIIGDEKLTDLEEKTVTKEAKENAEKPCVYGNIILNANQEKILLYAPNHSTYPKIDMEKFEKCFIDFHGPLDLRREKNIIRDFEAILVHKFGPSTPYEYETKMLAKFAKARTYFRLRNLVQALKDKKAEENAKYAAKRKVKADAKFQKLVDAEIEKREKATKRQHDATPGTSGTNTPAEIENRPKLAPKKLYKSIKDPRSYKQLGQHTTRNLK